MSEPIAFLAPIPDSATSLEADLVVDRLATWLAEVSAEATLEPPSTDVELPAAKTASP